MLCAGQDRGKKQGVALQSLRTRPFARLSEGACLTPTWLPGRTWGLRETFRGVAWVSLHQISMGHGNCICIPTRTTAQAQSPTSGHDYRKTCSPPGQSVMALSFCCVSPLPGQVRYTLPTGGGGTQRRFLSRPFFPGKLLCPVPLNRPKSIYIHVLDKY